MRRCSIMTASTTEKPQHISASGQLELLIILRYGWNTSRTIHIISKYSGIFDWLMIGRPPSFSFAILVCAVILTLHSCVPALILMIMHKHRIFVVCWISAEFGIFCCCILRVEYQQDAVRIFVILRLGLPFTMMDIFNHFSLSLCI